MRTGIRRIRSGPRPPRSAPLRHKIEKAIKDGKQDRIGKDQDYTPACDLVCPTQARWFGDLDDPKSEISMRIKATNAVQLKTHFGNKPQVYYTLDKGAKS